MRKVGIAAVLAHAAVTLGVASSSAGALLVPPVAGTMTCSLGGSLTLRLALKSTPSTGKVLVHRRRPRDRISPIPGTGANAGQDLMGVLVAANQNVSAFETQCEPFGAHYSGDAAFSQISKVL